MDSVTLHRIATIRTSYLKSSCPFNAFVTLWNPSLCIAFLVHYPVFSGAHLNSRYWLSISPSVHYHYLFAPFLISIKLSSVNPRCRHAVFLWILPITHIHFILVCEWQTLQFILYGPEHLQLGRVRWTKNILVMESSKEAAPAFPINS